MKEKIKIMKEKIDALLAHKKLNELLGNTVVFVAIYVAFMALTYVLPYYEMAGSLADGMNQIAASMNEATNGAAKMKTIDSSGGTFAFILHIVALSALVIITYVKAKQIKKEWFVILPVLAFGFDVLPLVSLIPLVPTGLHIATIIIAVKGEDKVAHVEPTQES